MHVEVVYLGRDNRIDLLLKTDGNAQSLASVTSMDLLVGNDVTISSEDYPLAFDWATDGSSGKLYLDLASALDAESVPVGTYLTSVVLYDTTHTNGIVWGSFVLKVLEDR